MKQKSLLKTLFYINSSFIFLFALCVLFFSYYSIYSSLRIQKLHSIIDEFYEIRKISKDFNSVKIVIETEVVLKTKIPPVFKVFTDDKVEYISSSHFFDDRVDQKIEDVKKGLLKEPNKIYSVEEVEIKGHSFLVLVGFLSEKRYLAIASEIGDIYYLLKKSITELAFYSVIFILMIVSISFYLSKRALRSVVHVVESAKKISEIELSTQIEEISKFNSEEVDELSQAFNTILKKVEFSVQDIYR